MPRIDGRQADQLRPLQFTRGYLGRAPGSVLASMGKTVVLCTCSVDRQVPEFLLGTGKGWLTAEYNMLPGSTSPRKVRDRAGKVDGRSVEIQRFIGRSLRAVFNLDKLGQRTLWVDCDVLQADGGTRTASINGAYLAMLDALASIRPLLTHPIPSIVTDSVAAVSLGILNGEVLLDLDYSEDKDVDVDLNLVMTGVGEFIEVQASGEEATFTSSHLDKMLSLGKQGIAQILQAQRSSSPDWPLD